MNASEFREWLSYHKAKFPGLNRWLGNLPDTPTEFSPSRSDVMASWLRTLGSIELDAAKAATDELGTDEHPEPRGWERHPIAIAAMCRTERRSRASRVKPLPKVVDGHSVYRCQSCRDTGAVDVWHPATMEIARKGEIDEASRTGRLYRLSVGCGCCEADSVFRDGVTFDPVRMLRAPKVLNDPEAIDELIRFVAEQSSRVHEWTPDSAFA